VQAIAMDPRTRTILDVNIDDLLEAFGWQGMPLLHGLVRRLARTPALRFAREMTAFDDAVHASGVAAAARAMLAGYTRAVRARNVQRIPTTGPVLLLSNHPGMTDTLSLFASIPRTDLLALAAERPFLRALPAASRSLIFLSEDRAKRFAAMRRAIDHLRAGGALLTFPAGEIEPDPAVLPGAVRALERWSGSSISFLRFVPDLTVVPIIVSGVLTPRAQRNPLALLRRRRADREKLAATLQVLVHTLFPSAWRVRVTVDAVKAFSGRELIALGDQARGAITAAVADFLRLRERASPGSSLPAFRR
jgi:hypothetical protein